jgi:alkyl sulfatase BDS1-like metallo-beta-lactamase superfamily hydrolase
MPVSVKLLIGCAVVGASFLASTVGQADGYNPEALKSGRADPSMHLQQGSDQREAQKINDVIYKATGFGNTFMVVTGEGNVIIDTSLPSMAPRHKALLTAVSDAPIHSIILTHGHGDHTGGVALWQQAQTQVIAQQNSVEFLAYQKRFNGLFMQRNAAQFGFDLTGSTDTVKLENTGANLQPNQLFDQRMQFTLGAQQFELIHTPAETYDALTVWMPQYKAAFVGDLFYRSFPNIYTLRGTKPRWALDYIDSINRVLALEPEILLPSHGEPIMGAAAIRADLIRYRDAIQYVHDETVKGMNAGRDVYALMGEIKLPAELDIGEAYGWVSWSVRGIYEGYMGWFDGQPVTMYDQSPQSVYSDLVRLAGGAEAVAAVAQQQMNDKQLVKALRLIEAALEAEPNNKVALTMRLQILTALRKASGNLNESGWLNYGIKQTERQLAD